MSQQVKPAVHMRTESMDSTQSSTDNDSPARSRIGRAALQKQLRPPPLVHAWDFWYEKEASNSNSGKSPPRTTTTDTTTTNATSLAANSTIPSTTSTSQTTQTTQTQSPITTAHNTTLTHLHPITDVSQFWSVFNNFSFSTLPIRASVHLFHTTITPTWEHPRNALGGAWTFRLPRALGGPFFRALSVLAIGEQLQSCVATEERSVFRDDICGLSFCVRSEKMVAVSIWNRDGGNEEGKKKLVECVLREVPRECRPQEGMYYYKRHEEHADFSKKAEVAGVGDSGNTGGRDVGGAEEVADEAAVKRMDGSRWSKG